jgi:hypothetical protein
MTDQQFHSPPQEYCGDPACLCRLPAPPGPVLAHRMVRVDGIEAGGEFIPLDVLISLGGYGGTTLTDAQQRALAGEGLIEPARFGGYPDGTLHVATAAGRKLIVQVAEQLAAAEDPMAAEGWVPDTSQGLPAEVAQAMGEVAASWIRSGRGGADEPECGDLTPHEGHHLGSGADCRGVPGPGEDGGAPS